MRAIDNILKIIELCKPSDISARKVEDLLGRGNGGLKALQRSESDFEQYEVDEIVENFSMAIAKAGFIVVDNYDVFGYKGKAIVEKDAILYDGKYKEVGGKDIEMEAGVSSGQSEPNESLSFEQQVLGALQFLQTLAETHRDKLAEIKGMLPRGGGKGKGSGAGKIDN